MKTRLTVSRLPSETRITTVETRYAFEDEIEAMFALGVVNALAQHLEKDAAAPVHSDREAMTPEGVAALQEAVRQRYVGINVPSAMAGVDEFLTGTESAQFQSAVAWLTRPTLREAAMDATDTSVAAVAGGLLLRDVMAGMETDGRIASRELLGRANRELLYDALGRLGMPDTVERFTPIPDPQHATVAQITLSATPVVTVR
jgi:hypothetical protein